MTSHHVGETGIELIVNGERVEVVDSSQSLLEVLREQLHIYSAKDGCSPQGQCGCCTVLVDGKPRVACVTPVRRLNGRKVTTLDGLDAERRAAWAEAFTQCGAAQCGFCTPGIIVRLDSTHAAGGTKDKLANALAAHQCRCTGWQTIGEAWDVFCESTSPKSPQPSAAKPERDLVAAERRATIEGHAPQQVGAHVALGQAQFAADNAPPDALIAVPVAGGEWAVGETLGEARRLAVKVQGRRTTATPHYPVEIPDGDWKATLRTTWVDAAYLEPDASWCNPGGEPASPGGNGGAFGAKHQSIAPAAAQRLANQYQRPVLALAGREDITRHAPKRPPVAGGVDASGRGVLRVLDGPDLDVLKTNIALVAPGIEVVAVPAPGPIVSSSVRAAGWAEAVALQAGATGEVGVVRSPAGSRAEAEITPDGIIRVSVSCGAVLDATVLRSYCIGAAHMAWSWLTSEQLTVDADGNVLDLTMRSFGVLKASDTPQVEVELDHDACGEPTNGSDAVFAAVAAVGWLSLGCPPQWPTKLR